MCKSIQGFFGIYLLDLHLLLGRIVYLNCCQVLSRIFATFAIWSVAILRRRFFVSQFDEDHMLLWRDACVVLLGTLLIERSFTALSW